MISWRNHCLENVYLTCERGITPSFVPLDLHFSVLQLEMEIDQMEHEIYRNYKARSHNM